MAKLKILFGEWLPDQPGLAGNVTDAVNCYPVANGYAPILSEVNYSADAGQDLLVSFAGKFSGETNLFAAGATQIYKFDSADQSLDPLTTTGYATVESWDVTQFGPAMILANGQDKLQAYYIGTSTYFADLSADAPTAKFVTVVKDFVVAANVASEENKVYWSDINDETDWTPDPTSQADSQILPDGGDITGVAGGEYGLIFLERAIYRMTYAGSPLFFQFDAISRTLGCISNGSIAQFENVTYFLADDGFYVCDGQSTVPIGAEKINRWFFSNALPSNIQTTMSATVDPVNKLVIWCFDGVFGSKYLLIYSINNKKFSYGITDAASISYALTPSATLEQLDQYSTSIDALETPLDSRVWAGGGLLFSGVRGQKIISFSGQKKTAEISSGDMDSGRSVLTLARPLVDNGSGSVAVAARSALDEPTEYTAYIDADSEGRCSLRSAGRYTRVKVKPSGNWETVIGVEVEVVMQGAR